MKKIGIYLFTITEAGVTITQEVFIDENGETYTPCLFSEAERVWRSVESEGQKFVPLTVRGESNQYFKREYIPDPGMEEYDPRR